MQHFSLHSATDTPLTRLDARVKLLATLALLVMVISSRGPLFPLLVSGSSLLLALRLGVRPRLLLRRFAQPLFIAAMVLLLKLLFSGHEPLFSLDLGWFTLAGQRDGLREGLLIASRVVGAVALVTTVGFVTPFTDLMAALAWLRVPRGFVEVALFAWRYLFVLLDDAQVVYHAQKNRLGYAGFCRGLRSFGTLTGALVIKAFDGSQNMTVAMVQRGYNGNLPLLRHQPLRKGDVAVSVLCVLVLGAVWIL